MSVCVFVYVLVYMYVYIYIFKNVRPTFEEKKYCQGRYSMTQIRLARTGSHNLAKQSWSKFF